MLEMSPLSPGAGVGDLAQRDRGHVSITVMRVST
jgi:hypothetical protein